MNVFIIIFFIGVNILLALFDAWRIKHNIRIRHAINAIVYFGLTLIFYKYLTVYKLLGILLLRIPIFNTALNVFRGLPADYVSPTTTSIIDQYITNPIIHKIGYWPYFSALLSISFFLILNL